MKILMSLFASLALVLSLNATANTVQSVYAENSELPAELRGEVMEAVLAKYPCIDSYGLEEAGTTVEINQVDQGVRDRYFATTFTARFTYDYHPQSGTVTVKSVRYDGTNPSIDWTEVQAVEGQSLLCE